MSPNPSQPKGEKRIVFLQADSVFCQGVSPLCSILFIIENFIIKQGQTELVYFGGPWEIFRFYGILIHTIIILQIKNNSKLINHSFLEITMRTPFFSDFKPSKALYFFTLMPDELHKKLPN